jgi:23S rRNA-/tRNA-specific pseudouridylate synthase
LKKTGLKTVHRLDRQTSGIVFFAKSDSESNKFREALLGDKVSKVYYARVLGDFSTICKDNKTVCNESIFCESNMDAIMSSCPADKVPLEHSSQAKDAKTEFKFKRLTKDGSHSIVKCYPQTGRTH